MKRILVTGATGFLGRHVIDALLENTVPAVSASGWIRILARTDNPWTGDPRIQYFCGDVTDPEVVRKAVSGVDCVLHLAGIVRRGPDAAEEMSNTHVSGTRHVCEAALAEGRPRVVVASSSGTVAVSRKPIVHAPTAPYATEVTAHWPYYVSKIEQEKLALAYHAEKDLGVVILNPSILLGPGDIYRSSTNDVRLFLEGKIPNAPSGGFSFVDARDAARAFVAAIDRGEPGHRYLISGHNLTVREFFGLLEQISGVRAPRLVMPEWLARAGAAVARRAVALTGRSYPVDDVSIQMAYRFWYCDNTLAARDLNFRARSAEDTLRDTIQFIRSTG